MNKKNIDIIKFIETTLDCKLYNYQKEVIRNMYTKPRIQQNLIINCKSYNYQEEIIKNIYTKLGIPQYAIMPGQKNK